MRQIPYNQTGMVSNSQPCEHIHKVCVCVCVCVCGSMTKRGFQARIYNKIQKTIPYIRICPVQLIFFFLSKKIDTHFHHDLRKTPTKISM